ncbi:MAG: hypothetical protein M3220_19555 [Chloroflexota bacterium]|nr:hypothetical protein [Chloroflexota bacterium]
MTPIWCNRLEQSHLPALSDVPRYRRHQFKQHAPTLASIAHGFETGYAQEDAVPRQALHRDEWLWTLDLAHKSYKLLQDGLSREMRLRRGDEANVMATLRWSLRVLEQRRRY